MFARLFSISCGLQNEEGRPVLFATACNIRHRVAGGIKGRKPKLTAFENFDFLPFR
jgi:hypothetical protein